MQNNSYPEINELVIVYMNESELFEQEIKKNPSIKRKKDSKFSFSGLMKGAKQISGEEHQALIEIKKQIPVLYSLLNNQNSDHMEVEYQIKGILSIKYKDDKFKEFSNNLRKLAIYHEILEKSEFIKAKIFQREIKNIILSYLKNNETFSNFNNKNANIFKNIENNEWPKETINTEDLKEKVSNIYLIMSDSIKNKDLEYLMNKIDKDFKEFTILKMNSPRVMKLQFLIKKSISQYKGISLEQLEELYHPEVKSFLPEINLPSISLPEIKLPEVNLSEIKNYISGDYLPIPDPVNLIFPPAIEMENRIKTPSLEMSHSKEEEVEVASENEEITEIKHEHSPEVEELSDQDSNEEKAEILPTVETKAEELIIQPVIVPIVDQFESDQTVVDEMKNEDKEEIRRLRALLAEKDEKHRKEIAEKDRKISEYKKEMDTIINSKFDELDASDEAIIKSFKLLKSAIECADREHEEVENIKNLLKEDKDSIHSKFYFLEKDFENLKRDFEKRGDKLYKAEKDYEDLSGINHSLCDSIHSMKKDSKEKDEKHISEINDLKEDLEISIAEMNSIREDHNIPDNKAFSLRDLNEQKQIFSLSEYTKRELAHQEELDLIQERLNAYMESIHQKPVSIRDLLHNLVLIIPPKKDIKISPLDEKQIELNAIKAKIAENERRLINMSTNLPPIKDYSKFFDENRKHTIEKLEHEKIELKIKERNLEEEIEGLSEIKMEK